MNKSVSQIAILAMIALAIFRCTASKSSSDSSADSSGTTVVTSSGSKAEAKEQTVIANSDAILELFPKGLVLGSPLLVDSTKKLTLATRQDELIEKLTGTTAKGCASVITKLSEAVKPTCYGPEVNFFNHPDSAESTGALAVGALPIWTSSEKTGESCITSKINAETTVLNELGSNALNLTAMILCAANIGDVAPPSTDNTKTDALALVKSILRSENIGGTLTTVEITRKAHAESKKPIFAIQSAIALETGEVLEAKVSKYTDPDDPTHHYGAVQSAIFEKASSESQDSASPDAAAESSYGLTIFYELIGEKIRFSYRFRNLTNQEVDEQKLSDIFNSSGEMDVAKNLEFSIGRVELEAQKGIGHILHGFTAESFANLRVLQARTVVNQTDQTISGCGYSGHGTSLNRTLELEPTGPWLDRIICSPRTGTEPDPGQPMLQEQCFAATSNKIMTPVTSHIAFAARQSCGMTTENNASFTWQLPDDSGDPQPFNNGNSLISISDLETGTLEPPTTPATIP